VRPVSGKEVTSSVQSHSILFERPDGTVAHEEPSFFGDLNLDQVLDSMTAGREEYDLKPFFYAPLHDAAAVRYRHDVLRDLQKTEVLEPIEAFAQTMRAMREHLAQAEKLHYRLQQESLFLDAVAMYCDAVSALTEELALLDLTSRGFQTFRAYLADYKESDGFTSLAAETRKLMDELAKVKYCVHISGSRVTVTKYDGEADYSAGVEKTFAKFKQGVVKDYRVKLPNWLGMNHVEARVLELVAGLYPELFLALDGHCMRHRNYLDHTIGAFDREVQFYLAYLEYIARFKSAGLPFCYPDVSNQPEQIYAHDAFDLALANKHVPEGSAVVCNDFFLTDPERIIVVTGPNQGGKTTFARMFGQLHHLASLGLQIPGTDARLFLPDRVFTHFEKEEDLANLRGKLEDELVRIHHILQRTTSNSVLIMNESFTSTTLSDSLLIGTQVLKQIIRLNLLCVCVTFVDELASLSETTVSMVSTVVPDNPATRTYKIVRKPADGLAYAAAIAEKYGLTYEALGRRIVR
jgi:DNA mismatch repair protein MutS